MIYLDNIDLGRLLLNYIGIQFPFWELQSKTSCYLTPAVGHYGLITGWLLPWTNLTSSLSLEEMTFLMIVSLIGWFCVMTNGHVPLLLINQSWTNISICYGSPVLYHDPGDRLTLACVLDHVWWLADALASRNPTINPDWPLSGFSMCWADDSRQLVRWTDLLAGDCSRFQGPALGLLPCDRPRFCCSAKRIVILLVVNYADCRQNGEPISNGDLPKAKEFGFYHDNN